MYILFLSLLAVASGNTFDKLYSWKQVNFNFPNENIRESYIKSGDYIEENNLPLGLAVSKDKMIITIPRWKTGVFSNLNYVWLNDTSESPILTPYPDFETNDIHLPDSIVSIFRLRIDDCNRLWAVDTGIDNIYGNSRVLQPTRIIVFDLNTDKIIRKYTLKDSDQKPNSFIADLVVDSKPDACEDAYAYLSDFSGYGLVVYSWAKNDSWRIEHNYFYFDPLHGDYNISGYNFQWTDGLFGLALTPFQVDGYRTLYFHAMSGITEFYVSTKVLQDDTLILSNNYHAFHVAGNKGPKSQGPSSVIDQNTRIAYFTQVQKNGIGCWDTDLKLTPETFILIGQDNETMAYPNDLAIDNDSRKLYVLSDNLPKFEHSNLSKKESNYFITVASLDLISKYCKA
ncbi:PREDICTED: protein yellow-like [Polistes dominula]|uniref:Protein yellow-like n=1 Tax=Polistes dominula TaxID=743375 RepID=A0ABM1HVX0_POLDO|nr:PREDICTED: protein yellow-like [Polistes dominula]